MQLTNLQEQQHACNATWLHSFGGSTLPSCKHAKQELIGCLSIIRQFSTSSTLSEFVDAFSDIT